MFISKKHSISNIENIYKDLTREYLKGVSGVLSSEDLVKYKSSTYLLSEGYRNALCILFDLKTEASVYLVRKYERQFVNILKPIYNKYNIGSFSVEMRIGLLEACIHCIEMSRKLVDKR